MRTYEPSAEILAWRKYVTSERCGTCLWSYMVCEPPTAPYSWLCRHAWAMESGKPLPVPPSHLCREYRREATNDDATE